MKTSTASSVLRAAVLCLTLLALPAAGHAQASKPGWGVDQTQALAKAKTDKKMVLMDFTGSDWCGWCIKMDKEIFSTPEFKKYAQDNLVLVELDFPHKKQLPPATKQQNDALAKQYGVQGFPTTVVLDSEGKTVKVFGGYVEGGATAFIATLEKLKTGAATTQAQPNATSTQTAQTTTAKSTAPNPLGNAHVQGSQGL